MFYLNQINKFGGKIVFESNLDEHNATELFPNNKFLQDIIVSWVKIKKENINKNGCIGKQILWNNKNIKIDNKTIMYKPWLDKGIQNIEHIFDYRKKEFYTFQEFSDLFTLPYNNFLKYIQIISCIPNEWKTLLKSENISTRQPTSLLGKLFKSDHVNKMLYMFQLKKLKREQIKAVEKWSKDIDKIDINWKNIYNNTFLSSIDSKLRNFQYKYLMRIVTTNKLLLKYKLKNSNLCEFCNMNIETIKHLFLGVRTNTTFLEWDITFPKF